MSEPEILNKIAQILRERKKADPASSYVASLYAEGSEKILAKIQEEAEEVIDAGIKDDDSHLVSEVADLWFHCIVLLVYRDIDVDEIFSELDSRFGISGHEEKRRRKH